MARTLLAPHRGATAPPAGRLSFSTLVGLTHLSFAHQFLWTALLVLTLPAQVVAIAGERNKDSALAGVLVVGALVAAVTQIGAGWLSDRATLRLGRRRPFIVVGTLVALAGLYLMSEARTIAALTAAFLVLQLGFNVAQAAYQAIVPDRVPTEQRGGASGLLALLAMLGVMAAALIAGATLKDGDFASFRRVYLIVIGLNLLLTTTTTLALRDDPPCQRQASSRGLTRLDLAALWRRLWAATRAAPDFAWVFITRFLIMMGYFTVLDFLLYYVRDELGAASATHVVSLLTLAVIASAAITSFFAGSLSDRVGRKPIVYASAGLMAAVSLAFIITHTVGLALVVAALWGLGWGAFQSVDWALATDALPRPARPGEATNFARYMGIWSLAITLPQVLAPAIGPLISAANGHARGSGYTLMFCVVFVYFLLGAVLLRNVRAVR